MITTVQNEVMLMLPSKRRPSSKGWISFDAVCCAHNGESRDNRGRGGINAGADGSISYHCFNCGYKTGYRPGRPIGYRFRKLLEWLGADEGKIQRLIVEAMRLRDEIDPVNPTQPKKIIEFKPRPLPPLSAGIQELITAIRLQLDYDDLGQANFEQIMQIAPPMFITAVEYLYKRKIYHKRYDFYITEDTAHNNHKRLIIPLMWKGECVGYTARALDDDVKPKYYTNHEPDFVFNMDMQTQDKQFVIVTEGPFDAMSVDGVAVLGSEISDQQTDIIDSLKREVIVVPDFDVHVDVKSGKKKWPGRSLIDAALDNNWSVSFPVWTEQYKDVSEATENFGKLFALKSIIDAKETSALKIELLTKKLYNTL